MRKFFAVLGILIGVTAATGIHPGHASAATTRPADTSECASSVTTHGGVTGNYCGSQALVALKLELAAPNKAVTYAQLTFKATSTTNPAEDFEFYHPVAASGNLKLVEFDPRGNPSGLCAALSNNRHNLVLKSCNANSAGQLWQATGPDPSGAYTWDSAATGQAITNATGAAYARAVMEPDTDSTGQAFTFTQ
jgi:hypothetical protein